MLSHSEEIINPVNLSDAASLAMPVRPKFSTSADMGCGENHSAIQQG